MDKEELCEQLGKLGYEGMDVSLCISLIEYGLLAKDCGKEYHCIVGIGINSYDHEYDSFDTFTIMKIGLKDFFGENTWAKRDEFEKWTGQDYDSMNDLSRLADLISYYGSENVLGVSYCPVELEVLVRKLKEESEVRSNG